jgi:hypothetical protein
MIDLKQPHWRKTGLLLSLAAATLSIVGQLAVLAGQVRYVIAFDWITIPVFVILLIIVPMRRNEDERRRPGLWLIQVAYLDFFLCTSLAVGALVENLIHGSGRSTSIVADGTYSYWSIPIGVQQSALLSFLLLASARGIQTFALSGEFVGAWRFQRGGRPKNR